MNVHSQPLAVLSASERERQMMFLLKSESEMAKIGIYIHPGTICQV